MIHQLIAPQKASSRNLFLGRENWGGSELEILGGLGYVTWTATEGRSEGQPDGTNEEVVR